MAASREVFDRLCVKTNRAYKHIDDLAKEVAAFDEGGAREGKPRPYSFSHKDDTERGERTFYVHFDGQIPSHWAAIIGDALQNLKSALDHLATHLVSIGNDPRVKHPYFPCFESPEKYKAGKMGKIQGARPEAIKAIDATQPYPRGDGWTLWDIHTLNNRDKHRLLIPVWGSLLSHSFPKSEKERIETALKETFPSGLSQGWLKAAHGPVFLEDGDPVLTLPISELQERMYFRIAVAFREPDIVRGKPVVPTLHGMAQKVDWVIKSFFEKGLL